MYSIVNEVKSYSCIVDSNVRGKWNRVTTVKASDVKQFDKSRANLSIARRLQTIALNYSDTFIPWQSREFDLDP